MLSVREKARFILHGCGKSSFINTLNRVNNQPQGDITFKDWKIDPMIYNDDIHISDDICCVEVKEDGYSPPEGEYLNISLLLVDARDFKKIDKGYSFVIVNHVDAIPVEERRTIQRRVYEYYDTDVYHVFLWRSYISERYNEEKLDTLVVRTVDILVRNYIIGS